MPTVFQQPIDVQWVVALASGTFYIGQFAALTAALALSAANANAPVQLANVLEQVTAPNSPLPAQVNLVNQQYYAVQLQSATTYYPLETARVQAYATSASNANAPVYLAKVTEVVTAP